MIVRGKYVITRALDRHRWEEIDEGTVLQQDRVITAIGAFADLRRNNPGGPVVGDGQQVLLSGFVNAHHHIRLSTVQLGISDTTLELWFATRIAMRDCIPYYDTLYSCFEMVASGTTTAQHVHGWIPGDTRQTEAEAESIIRAYEDIGMRVSYCYALREQNHLVYEANEQFRARLPTDVLPLLAKYFSGFQMPARETIALFDHLRAKHKRVRIQLVPSNQQWCTDEGLAMLAESAEKHDVLIHMHLVETTYQKQYARIRGDGGNGGGLHRAVRLAWTENDARPRRVAFGGRPRQARRNTHERMPQLQFEFSPAQWRAAAQST